MDNPEEQDQVNVEEETRIVLGFDELEINGETVKVNEFTFPQELKALTIAEPIIGAIADLYVKGDDPNMLVIESVFSTYAEAMVELLSISTGKPLEWFNALPGKYASPIFLTFWGVNSHFFTQRIASLYVMGNPDLLKRNKEKLDSEKHSQH